MPKTILLVDDDASLRQTLRLNLEEQGVKIKEATNGDEAISELEREKPSLMVLDILMPKRDGYAVLNYMRERSIDVPVVVLSSLSDFLNREKCLKLGAKDYFIKSDLDEDELWTRIQKYL